MSLLLNAARMRVHDTKMKMGSTVNKYDNVRITNPSTLWPKLATYVLTVQQVQFEQLSVMTVFDIDQNNGASIDFVLTYFFIETILKV